MSNATKLVANQRNTFGKGVARKLRATGQTPVVVYGHGKEPQHLSVETHPLSLIVRHANALIELQVEGGKKQLVLVKDVQKDPVRQMIEHVDLITVSKNETVEVEIPVVLEGESFPGTAPLQDLATLVVNAPAISIPENITLSVEGLEEGAQITAADIKLDSGVTLVTDPETIIVNVVVPREELPEDEADDAADENGEGADAAESDASSENAEESAE